MLRRALERGVSAARLAQALNVDVSSINKRAQLLQGICQEAIELLADRQFSPEVTRELRKMKPIRQVECVELMVAANTVTLSYAKALLATTGESPGGGIQTEETARRHGRIPGPTAAGNGTGPAPL